MSQIFHHSTNTIAKVSIFGTVFGLAGGLWLMLEINRSAYVTDVGMTGPHGGVIGVRAGSAIERFLKQTPNRFDVADDDVRFQAVVITVDTTAGRATGIERIDEPYD